MGACVECGQQVTNPICPERLAEQMTTWLLETRPELIGAFNDKTEEILPQTNMEDKCVITGKKMSLCPYCYTEHIFYWLRSINLDKDLLKEYLTFFHYDGERLGYWANAESEGLTP